jgi:excisionase family DNA binding protein
MNANNFLSVRQAAAESGYCEGTIRQWIREGKLPVTRVGYHILIDRGELERLKRSRARGQP